MEMFKYKIEDEIDYVFEEQGNQFNALRKVKWGDNGEARLELRRWRNAPDGSEVPAKGMTFLTEEGPHELVNTMTANGYGHTIDILKNLSTRADFKKCLNSVVGEDSEFYDKNVGKVEDEFFDPYKLLIED